MIKRTAYLRVMNKYKKYNILVMGIHRRRIKRERS